MTFLARMMKDRLVAGTARGLGVNGRTAVWVEANGMAEVVGAAYAYFLVAPGLPQSCANTNPPTALQYWSVPVRRMPRGIPFPFAEAWNMEGDFGTRYRVTAANGDLTSNQPDGSIY